MFDDEKKKGENDAELDNPTFADPRTEEETTTTPREPRTQPPPRRPDEKKKDPTWRGAETSQEPGMSRDLDPKPETGRDADDQTA